MGECDFLAGAEMTSDRSLQGTVEASEDTKDAWLVLC